MPLALLYHAVLPLPASFEGQQRTLFVDPGELGWQLGELARRGFHALTLDEFHAAVVAGDEDDRSLLLTFDDAYAHILDTVTPLLGEHSHIASVFVPWAHRGSANDWDGEELPVHGLPVAGAAALREALDSGVWELGSHGLRHVDLRTVAPAELDGELEQARRELSTLAGRPVLDLAYPYGASNVTVRESARRTGHRMAFAASASGSTDRFALPRHAVRGQEGRRAFTIKIDSELRRIFE